MALGRAAYRAAPPAARPSLDAGDFAGAFASARGADARRMLTVIGRRPMAKPPLAPEQLWAMLARAPRRWLGGFSAAMLPLAASSREPPRRASAPPRQATFLDDAEEPWPR